MSVIKCMSDDLFAELERDVIRRDVVCAILSKLRRHRIAVDFERLSQEVMNHVILGGPEKYKPEILIDFIRFICKNTRYDTLYVIFLLTFYHNSTVIVSSRMVFRAFFRHGVVPRLTDFFHNFSNSSISMAEFRYEHEHYACLGEILGTGYEFEDMGIKNGRMRIMCNSRLTFFGIFMRFRQVETSFYVALLVEY